MFTSNHYQWCYNVFFLGRPLKERMPTEYNLYRLFCHSTVPTAAVCGIQFLAVLTVSMSTAEYIIVSLWSTTCWESLIQHFSTNSLDSTVLFQSHFGALCYSNLSINDLRGVESIQPEIGKNACKVLCALHTLQDCYDKKV